jgi:hypothetical protein
MFAITLGSATDGELASFLSSISFKISTFGAQRQYKKIFQKKGWCPTGVQGSPSEFNFFTTYGGIEPRTSVV